MFNFNNNSKYYSNKLENNPNKFLPKQLNEDQLRPRLERTIQLGRGPFGTAHSQRMGVISSALPGLRPGWVGGGSGARMKMRNQQGGRDRRFKREMAAKKKTGGREGQKGRNEGGKGGKVRRSGGMSDSEEGGQEDADGGGKERTQRMTTEEEGEEGKAQKRTSKDSKSWSFS